ncbi:hypothetical protein [Pelagibacterium mangrovi]|uniref:hypothetical protein n=1 Tax=Pelagibacterium mangrovi TaxID=3119828 RepID=UPI002FC995FD
MNKLLVTTALVGVAALGVTSSAQAFGGGHPWWPPHPGNGDDDCIECIDNAINLEQVFSGFQKAFNNISDVGDVTDAAQTALNAANLISLDGIDISDVNIGEVDQEADLDQIADNDIYASVFATLYNIEQSATNVANVFSAPEVNDIDQDAWGYQDAFNTIEFGKGGYDADALYDEEGELLPTQAALNAVNMITVDQLTGQAVQMAAVGQTAINTMSYAGGGYSPFGYGGHHGWVDVDVYDVGQTATNVANVFSATDIVGLDCGCVSVLQDAEAAQFAANNFSGSGWSTDLTNIVQEATNIANSISYLTPEVAE